MFANLFFQFSVEFLIDIVENHFQLKIKKWEVINKNIYVNEKIKLRNYIAKINI